MNFDFNKYEILNANDIEKKLEKDNLTLKDHIQKMQQAIKKLKNEYVSSETESYRQQTNTPILTHHTASSNLNPSNPKGDVHNSPFTNLNNVQVNKGKFQNSLIFIY